MKLFETIPNISTSDINLLKLIEDKLSTIDNIKLLEISSDKSHNRSVLTVIGSESGIIDSMLALTSICLNHIDLRFHKGCHHRNGAVAVIPIVPYKDVTIDEAIDLSIKLSEKIYSEYNIPVYLYANSARKEEYKSLSFLRKGQFEMLNEKIKSVPFDYGDAVHPTFGAVAIGARDYLLAYNINLNCDNVNIAKEIANTIREKSGGYKNVMALGFLVDVDGCNYAQVSMNLTDYNQTNIIKIYDAVKSKASEYNVTILNSEIIGFIPKDALYKSFKEKIKLKENIYSKVLDEQKINSLDNTLEEFINSLASLSPTPGGGSVASLVGSLASGLISMVSNYTLNKEKYKNVQDDVVKALNIITNIIDQFNISIDDDINAYNKVSKAYKMPKETEEEINKRNNAINNATKEAMIPPYKVMEISKVASDLLYEIYDKFNVNLISDFGVSAKLLIACCDSAYLNLLINAKMLDDEFTKDILTKALTIKNELTTKCEFVYENILKKLCV